MNLEYVRDAWPIQTFFWLECKGPGPPDFATIDRPDGFLSVLPRGLTSDSVLAFGTHQSEWIRIKPLTPEEIT